MPAVKKVGAIMRVDICMRKAFILYGHSADQVRAAHPKSSDKHPIAKTAHHQFRFQINCAVCSIIERPKRAQKVMPAAKEGW